MAPRTRTKSTKNSTATTGKAADAADAVDALTLSKFTLEASHGPAPKLFILPKLVTPEARIVLLPHPRHGRPARFIVSPEAGFYEIKKVSAPTSSPRSWLIEHCAKASDEKDSKSGDAVVDYGAQVVADPELHMATAIDPLFFMIPALVDGQPADESSARKRLLLSSDEYFDRLPDSSSHLTEILRWRDTRTLIERRMATVCDTVEAGDETMFRLNEEKLLKTMVDKASKMGEGGLPPSMEDKFVKRALEAPVLLSNTDAADCEIPNNEASDVVANAAEVPPDVVRLQRLRTAFNFICSSYLPPPLAEKLQRQLKNSTCTDFSALEDYLAKLARLRAEAAELSSLANVPQKRSSEDEVADAQAEKKRKLEEDKQRKASETRGVRELKKVNTSGMKKLSHFFKKT
ncbi:Ribonuclease H2, subunit B [Ophiocordyceps camponoti-floridani]|uniref:Ribonuclease H2 subunit B n=1 Tax=Ophiocordyceps camponoti-floridani TaxID=2030778 RepID=A0A8H4QE72_9HYPO|nr:Ribonuclease H2, subunit B [Ophiocordyceps camponoti-floridani]